MTNNKKLNHFQYVNRNNVMSSILETKLQDI